MRTFTLIIAAFISFLVLPLLPSVTGRAYGALAQTGTPADDGTGGVSDTGASSDPTGGSADPNAGYPSGSTVDPYGQTPGGQMPADGASGDEAAGCGRIFLAAEGPVPGDLSTGTGSDITNTGNTDYYNDPSMTGNTGMPGTGADSTAGTGTGADAGAAGTGGFPLDCIAEQAKVAPGEPSCDVTYVYCCVDGQPYHNCQDDGSGTGQLACEPYVQ